MYLWGYETQKNHENATYGVMKLKLQKCDLWGYETKPFNYIYIT